MPVKRPHRKSRNGCKRCRERRVKCDEGSPECSTCVKRGEICEYALSSSINNNMHKNNKKEAWLSEVGLATPEGSNDSTTQHEGTRGENDSEMETTTTTTTTTSSSRFYELHLMHHWCTRTCNSFTPNFGEICREFVPREAQRHAYLMDALLAITSLHIATETEDAAAVPDHVRAALQYQNSSVSSFKIALQHISPDNIDAVVLASIFLMVGSILSPLLPTPSDHQVQSTASAMIPLVEFLKGIGIIVTRNRHWLQKGPLADWFHGTRDPVLRLDQDFPSDGFELLNRAISITSNANNDDGTLAKATQSLREAYHHGRSMLRWLSLVEPAFLEKLRQQEDAALAIFMYWGVLLDQANDMWWASFAGKRLVHEISNKLDERGHEWEKLTRWCRCQVYPTAGAGEHND